MATTKSTKATKSANTTKEQKSLAVIEDLKGYDGGTVKLDLVEVELTPTIKNFDEIHEANQAILKALGTVVLTGTEEERKNYGKALASVRKMKKSVHETAKEECEAVCRIINEQVAILKKDYDDIVLTLGERKSFYDNAFHDERMAVIEEAFRGHQVINPNLDSVELDAILDPTWLNRSTTEKQVREGMNKRVDIIDNVTKTKTMPTFDIAKKVAMLDGANWELSQALADYQDDIDAERAREALQKQKESDDQRLEAAKNKRVILKISLPENEVDAALKVLSRAKINYERL